MSAWRSLKKMSNYRTMRKGLIGVIVPVYKTEEYIAECIESILAQTYRKFRLILVDDGSPDAAGTICDEYAAKDSRITVIHQENAGVTRARGRGVEEANDCEWITFVNTEKDVYICANNIYNYRDNNSSITHTFERDLEYYQEVQKLRIASFPEENYNDYLITTIPKRLQIWREHYLYKSKVPEMIGNCSYIELKNRY